MDRYNEIFGDRLKRARIMRGLSMDALCERMETSVSKQAISKYESGLNIPGSQILISLANALEVSPDYFFRPAQYSIQKVEFRKKAKLGARKAEAIKEVVRDKVERYLEVEELLDIKSDFVNPLKDKVIVSDEDVAEAAKEMRLSWELGEDGISSVTELLESRNIKVVEVEEDDAFDGLSGFVNSDRRKPFVVLNKSFSIERKRFTALHELGHIAMNIQEDVDDRRLEKLCNTFASEMLISGDVFSEIIGNSRKDIYLKELIPLQLCYGISVEALMLKAERLNIIPQTRFRSFFIRKNKNQAFKSAVESSRYPVDEQSSRFCRLVYRALASDLISYSKAAVLLNEPIEDVRKELALV